jgi:hypothetical protein
MLQLSEKTKQTLAKLTPEQRERVMEVASRIVANRAKKMYEARAKLKASNKE